MQRTDLAQTRPSFRSRLRAGSRLALLAAGLVLVVTLAPAGGPADASDVRPITLPIQGDQVSRVRWTDTFGAPRSGGRSHIGVDMMGAKMVPIVAARAGVVTWGKFDNAGGNYVRFRDDDGYEYQYIHLNNDTPGTDDGRAACTQAFSAKLCATVGANGRLALGTRVEEGELIGYLGDSGNAESTGAHLHFEIYKPSGGSAQPINPTPSVDAALARLKQGVVPISAPAPAAPVPAAAPPLAAPGQPGFADHFWFQLHGRYPSSGERSGYEYDANALGQWPAMAKRLDQSSTAAAVDRLYHGFFLRYPDTEGLRYWIAMRGAGVSLNQVAENFATSEEFRLRYGGKDFGAFLDQLYRDVLGREPDAQGKDYWLRQLQGRKVTRGSIVANFTESAEMKGLTGWRNELVALQLIETGTAPTADDEARWNGLRQTMSLGDAIAQWYTN